MEAHFMFYVTHILQYKNRRGCVLASHLGPQDGVWLLHQPPGCPGGLPRGSAPPQVQENRQGTGELLALGRRLDKDLEVGPSLAEYLDHRLLLSPERATHWL